MHLAFERAHARFHRFLGANNNDSIVRFYRANLVPV
eukprot:SAG31_NODE_974_length_10627_cov_11.246201_13_plen_36_part_00